MLDKLPALLCLCAAALVIIAMPATLIHHHLFSAHRHCFHLSMLIELAWILLPLAIAVCAVVPAILRLQLSAT